MKLEPLRQWLCDACGRLIENPHEGTLEYRYILDAEPSQVDFRIVHNGNVNAGLCQHAEQVGDLFLEDLSGERGLLRMLGVQSSDPSWAETVRRVLVPHYEEARLLFKRARAGGREVIEEKLTTEQLVAIIEEFTS